MPALPNPNDKQFTPCPPGNHIAVCYRVIDLGTQKVEWKGQAKMQHKILISWEIPDEKMEDGKPFTIGQRFTWSMSEKASLRHVLESWRGKPFIESDFGNNGFDIKNVIGVGCMLNVVHATNNGKTYGNIASVAKLPKGLNAPSPVNPPCFLWLSREEFQLPVFEKLSDGLKATIIDTPEYKSLSDPEYTAHNSDQTNQPLDDEIPF